jgi:hypothetical protein
VLLTFEAAIVKEEEEEAAAAADVDIYPSTCRLSLLGSVFLLGVRVTIWGEIAFYMCVRLIPEPLRMDTSSILKTFLGLDKNVVARR